MTATLSPPVRVAALVGVLVLTGLAAVVLLLGRGELTERTTGAASPVGKTTPRSATTPKPAVRARSPRIEAGFPPKIGHALRYKRVVVVSVSLPGAAVDAVVRRAARAAAMSSRAGFVAISAADERAISNLVAKIGVIPAPAVVVLKRPGVVVTTFSVTDAGTIAQAVAQARR